MTGTNPYLAAIHVVCTHAGLHPDQKTWQFGETIPDADGRYGWPVNRSRSGEMRIVPRHQRRVHQAGGAGRFRCPICGINPRPSLDQWRQLCEALRHEGRRTLDLNPPHPDS